MLLVSSHVCSVAVAISENPEIRQILVDLQSGMDPDEVETMLKKRDDDEAATVNRKTRRLECFMYRKCNYSAALLLINFQRKPY